MRYKFIIHAKFQLENKNRLLSLSICSYLNTKYVYRCKFEITLKLQAIKWYRNSAQKVNEVLHNNNTLVLRGGAAVRLFIIHYHTLKSNHLFFN